MGPQGLKIQAKSPARPRPAAPSKTYTPSPTTTGPQGLPAPASSPQRPTTIKRTNRAARPEPRRVQRKQAKALRHLLKRQAKVRAAKARRRSVAFGLLRTPTVGLSRSRYNAAKAAGNREYDYEKAHELNLPGGIVGDILEAPIKLVQKAHQGNDLLANSRVNKGLSRAGLGAPVSNRAVAETADIAANMPASVFLAGKAAVKAAHGDTSTAEALWKDYKRTSAIPAAVSGNFKEAARRAREHPVSTALELSGFKAGIGRGAGVTARSGVLGRAAKRAASTERPNLRLADHPGAPEVKRRYSKDVINKAAQRAVEKHHARRGRDPHLDRGSRLTPSLPAGRKVLQGSGGRLGGPAPRPRLRRDVDTAVAGHERVRRARQDKAKADVGKVTPTGPLSRFPQVRGRGKVSHREGPAVQLQVEGVIRRGSERADLNRNLRSLQRSYVELKRTGADAERLRLNREQQKHLRELLNLKDEDLVRVAAAARDYSKLQQPIQARGRKVGAWDERGQSKRFYPALQSHVRRPARVERRALTADETQVAAKVIERRLRRGKPVPERLAERIAAPARERVPVRHDVGASKIDPRTLEVVARDLGIRDPIVIRDLTTKMRERGTRAGNIQRRTADGRPVHVVYLDLRHGRGAQSSALRHELEHLRDRERGVKFSSTTGLTPKQYVALPTEQRANAAMFRDERDLTAPARAHDLVTRRPKVGQQKTLKREDIRAALARTRRTEHVPGRKLDQKELEQVARVLQRRSRRGKETLSGMPEGGPSLVTQRPIRTRPTGEESGAYVGQFPVPMEGTRGRRGTAFEQGARELGSDALARQHIMSEAQVTAAEGFQHLVRRYSAPAGSGGRRFAETRDEAEAAARARTAADPTGLEYTPVNIASFQTFGARLTRKQNESARLDAASAEREAMAEVWDAAVGESGRGSWVLMPREVVDRLRAHASVRSNTPVNGLTNWFKDVVLTTSSPASWIFGNVTDITMRSVFAGLTPFDIIRGARGVRAMARQGYEGEMAAANLTGGGLYHAGEAVGRSFKPASIGEHPLHTIAAAPWRGYKAAIYNLEHMLEELPQYGVVGKEMKRSGVHGSLLRMRRATDAEIEAFARGVATDTAHQRMIQKSVEDVIGRWGKVSPAMRNFLTIAPFAQWLGAATRYVLVTLPVHHPIKTGIMAGISEMTETERKRLGLSYLLPRNKQAYEYQMGTLPIHVSEGKYGPIVKGLRTSRFTSFGTAAELPDVGSFLLPQFAGPLDAFTGLSFTNEQLVYPEWWPEKNLRGLPLSKQDRLTVGIGALVESVVPFASAYRRTILDKGGPSEPFSTILTPARRRKLNYDTGRWEQQPSETSDALGEFLLPWTKESQVYTYGAGRDIERSQITTETLKEWNARRKRTSSAKEAQNPLTPAPTEDAANATPGSDNPLVASPAKRRVRRRPSSSSSSSTRNPLLVP